MVHAATAAAAVVASATTSATFAAASASGSTASPSTVQYGTVRIKLAVKANSRSSEGSRLRTGIYGGSLLSLTAVSAYLNSSCNGPIGTLPPLPPLLQRCNDIIALLKSRCCCWPPMRSAAWLALGPASQPYGRAPQNVLLLFGIKNDYFWSIIRQSTK